MKHRFRILVTAMKVNVNIITISAACIQAKFTYHHRKLHVSKYQSSQSYPIKECTKGYSKLKESGKWSKICQISSYTKIYHGF